MKLIQAREWADSYLESYGVDGDTEILTAMLIDAYTAGWREGWEDGEMCGYNNGRDHDEVSLEIVRNAGIQEGIERICKLHKICPKCGLTDFWCVC